MKKKALETLPLMLATDEMMQMVRRDTPEKKTIRYTYSGNYTYYAYKKYTYMQAKGLENGLLMIAIYRRNIMAKGTRNPLFVLYIDRQNNEFATYNVVEKKWSNAKIDMLHYEVERGETMVENTIYVDKTSERLINTYLNTGRQPARAAILSYQYEVRKEQLKEKYNREIDEIDDAMELIPEQPADLVEWVKEYGFYTERYIIFHAETNKKEKEAYCLQCGKTIKVIQPRRGKEYKCPECKKKATLYPWKSAAKDNYHNICVLQRLTDKSGWVARRFRARMIADSKTNWVPRYYITEEVRNIFDNNLFGYGHYEYGNYRQTGSARWCHKCNEPNKSSGYYNYYEFGDARIYWNNLSKERKDSIIKYIPLEKALRQNPGTYIHIGTMMTALKINPQVEYLIKMGLKRLSIDALKRNIVYKPGKKIWEALGISKELFMLAKQYDVSARELETLQEAEKLGYRLSKTETRFFTKYLHRDIKKLVIYSTPHKYYRYFNEVLKNDRKYGDYMDYLEAAEKCKYNMRNEMVLFPKNFTQAHDEAIADRLAREKKLEAMKARQQDREYRKLVPDIKAMFQFEDDNFFIKVPEKKADFTSEGHNNHNCVATYFERALKGDCVIVFIRKKSEPDKSFCTVEIRNTISIQQLRSGYNKDAPEEAKEFAKKWMKEVTKRQEKKIAENRVVVPVSAVG